MGIISLPVGQQYVTICDATKFPVMLLFSLVLCLQVKHLLYITDTVSISVSMVEVCAILSAV